MNLARKKGLRVGAAPDTFLGAGIQTCIRLINEGAIGAPVAATAFMTCHGHESWHPDPAFYYAPGGGPVFDMGPYYFTALIALLGPARRVSGPCRAASRAHRRIGPQGGPGHRGGGSHACAGTIDFECGAVASFIMSFDIWHAELPRIEIYGSEGSLSVPDPNTFGGPVRIRAARTRNGATSPCSCPTRRTRAAWGCPRWWMPSRRAGRTGHPARSPSTRWRSCTPCTMHPARSGT